VYGPGGYSNKDFLKFGSPMQLILWLSSTAMVATTTSETWFTSWMVSVLAFVAVAAIRLTNGAILHRKSAEGVGTTVVKGSKDGSSWHFHLPNRPGRNSELAC
jgi:hypothetical protein